MRKNRKYSPEFKISCILGMRENNLSYLEASRIYLYSQPGKEHNNEKTIKRWERIFLEEGEAGLYKERRGRKMNSPNKGRKRKISKEVKDDLITDYQRLKEENLYLKAENEYLKKLRALIQAEEQRKKKK